MNYEKYYNAGYTAYQNGVPLSVALKALATRAARVASALSGATAMRLGMQHDYLQHVF